MFDISSCGSLLVNDAVYIHVVMLLFGQFSPPSTDLLPQRTIYTATPHPHTTHHHHPTHTAPHRTRSQHAAHTLFTRFACGRICPLLPRFISDWTPRLPANPTRVALRVALLGGGMPHPPRPLPRRHTPAVPPTTHCAALNSCDHAGAYLVTVPATPQNTPLVVSMFTYLHR